MLPVSSDRGGCSSAASAWHYLVCHRQQAACLVMLTLHVIVATARPSRTVDSLPTSRRRLERLRLGNAAAFCSPPIIRFLWGCKLFSCLTPVHQRPGIPLAREKAKSRAGCTKKVPCLAIAFLAKRLSPTRAPHLAYLDSAR